LHLLLRAARHHDRAEARTDVQRVAGVAAAEVN